MNYERLASEVLAIVAERAYGSCRAVAYRSDCDVDDLVGEAMAVFVDSSDDEWADIVSPNAIGQLAEYCLSEAVERIRATMRGTRESRSERYIEIGRMKEILIASSNDADNDAVELDYARRFIAELSGLDDSTIDVLTSDANHTEAGEMIGVSKTTIRRKRSTLATLVVCAAAECPLRSL